MATWEQYATCATADPESWFPKPGDPGTTAKEICRERCHVRDECLADALAEEAGQHADSRHGIRGGLGPIERYRLDQTTPQPQPAG